MIIPFYSYKSIFSNFHPAKFELDRKKFENSEQAYQYLKAKYFGDQEKANEILEAKSPLETKRIAKKIKGFNKHKWMNVAFEIMKRVLLAKFTKEPFRTALLETGNKTLVECSPFDKIWGLGMDAKNPDIYDMSKWKGTNLLGKALMTTRDSLRATIFFTKPRPQ